MKRKFIAAFAFATLACWNVSAAFAMPWQRPVQHASQAPEHSCCPRLHAQLAALLSALTTASEMPCGDQHPCCAKQGPESAPALTADRRVERPKSHVADTDSAIPTPPIERIAISTSAARFLPSYYVRSTVLRN